MRRLSLASLCFAAAAAFAQMPMGPLAHGTTPGSPLTQPTLSPGMLQLLDLDGRFSDEVQKEGGAPFTRWFAEDALTLNNGKAPVYGKARIAAAATWTPKEYQLSWQPLGGQMGPSGDMGFTWGHYDGTSKDKNGNPVSTGGRYITIWKRMPGGDWKVLLDASADEPAAAGECCVLPKP